MTSTPAIVVVGASLAGAKAAEAARGAGFEGRVVLVGEEARAPYERPPLSKDVLRGEKEPASASVHDPGFYDEHGIELVQDLAVAVDPVTRHVELAGGERIPFASLVLATGARPRALDGPGSGLDGVHHLRTVDDAVRLGEAIRGAGRVAVIGAGWIGSEVAASARQMGADVVLVDPAPVPLHRVLGDEVGAVFRRLHADHGVQLRLSTGVRRLEGTKAVEAIVLDDGTVEDADVVVVGIGVVPRTELAEHTTGMRVDNGVLVDQHLESNVTGIFAAGDVANAWTPRYGRHLRVEHWANARDQGETAGRNAAGGREVHDRLPFFFSDQYDLGMEYRGHGSADDDVVFRGDVDGRQFIAFWHREGVVTAAMNVNIWDVGDELQAIVAGGAGIDPARLADTGVPLGELVG